MKIKFALCLLLTTLLLCSCNGDSITETTSGTSPANPSTSVTNPSVRATETTAPTTPPAREEGTRLSGQQIQSYQQLFAWQLDSYSLHPRNPYNIALTIEFASPEEIDIAAFFENGFVDLLQLTEDETAWLEAQGYSRSRDMYVLPVARMNEVLQQYLGMTLEQTLGIGLDSLPYNEALDCYYNDPGGVRCMIDFVITDGYAYDDGLIRLYYTNQFGIEYVFSMQSNLPDGGYGYRFLSNLPTDN